MTKELLVRRLVAIAGGSRLVEDVALVRAALLLDQLVAVVHVELESLQGKLSVQVFLLVLILLL